jgi:hypothetical protein
MRATRAPTRRSPSPADHGARSRADALKLVLRRPLSKEPSKRADATGADRRPPPSTL